jgi:hypothetical protein
MLHLYVGVFTPLSTREATAPERNREKYSIGFVIFVLLRGGRFMCGLF